MALNCKRNVVPAIRMNNDMNSDGGGCSRRCQWLSNREGKDRISCDVENMDWEHVLPADPFGMDISSTFDAISGLIDFLEVDYGVYGRGEVGGKGDSSILAGLNFWFNNAVEFEGCCFREEELGWSFFDGGVGFACFDKDLRFYDVDGGSFSWGEKENKMDVVCEDLGSDDGLPHPALGFALGYLGVRDLLTMERVCKSLRDMVQNDTLLWRNIHIGPPLNDRITDDILLQLTSRAQGNLQCLSLVECPRITDDGLRCVLKTNMRLNKLSVPGCTRLSIDGIVSCLRDFKRVAVTGIEYLRVGGLYGVKQDHFEELRSLLPVRNHLQRDNYQKLFYDRANSYLSCEDDRPIDIEMCPRCQNFKLVYDCPAESCQGKGHGTQLCRACTICIPRCAQCGKCINDGEYEETFCLELLCFCCWKQLLQCQDKREIGISSTKSVVLQEPISSSYG